jgi:DNA-binding transcriptional regulator GbsR (MarR family)
VHKFKKPGSKKIYYECQHDVKIILKKKMSETRGHVKKLIKVLEEAEEKLAEDKNPDAVRIRGHIADMRKEYERINSLWGLLTTMHIIGKEK